MKKLLILCLGFALLQLNLKAQNPASLSFQANQVRATINADGRLFSNGASGQFIPVQPGLAEQTLLRGSGIWVAGLDPAGNLKGSVTLPNQSDFRTGTLEFDGSFSGYPMNDIWTVTCGDVSQHLNDLNDNGVIDQPNPGVLGFPGKGNPYFSQYNALELPISQWGLGGFYDADNNGLYNPGAGDYPAVEVRGCPLTVAPARQSWFVMQDVTSHSTTLAPVSLEVQTQVIAFQPVSTSLLHHTVFVRYKIINLAQERLDSVHVGLFADFDIGNPNDDFMGTIPDQEIMYGYNGDNQDEGGFDAEIPVMAVKMLRGPLDTLGQDQSLRYMTTVPSISNLQELEYYRLLTGHFVDGSPAPNNGVMYPGNPAVANSNSEITAGNTPGQRVGIASYGPFSLLPGAVNELIVAYFYIHAPGNTPVQNVQKLYDDNSEIQALFDNCFLNISCSAGLSASPDLIPNQFSIFPNPTGQDVTIRSAAVGFSRIELSDLLGRKLHTIQLDQPANTWTLQLPELPAGTYMLQVDGVSKLLSVQR